MAMTLHWVMAIIIIFLLVLGETLIGGHGASWKATLHTSLGFLVLGLVFLRLLWRFKNPPPPPIAGTPHWQILATKFSHVMFYVLMIVIPMAGWLAYTEHVRRSLGVAPASFFWLTKIPLLPDFGINFHLIHNWAGKAAIALIALHVLAAMKHHFYDKDSTLRRMLPWG